MFSQLQIIQLCTLRSVYYIPTTVKIKEWNGYPPDRKKKKSINWAACNSSTLLIFPRSLSRILLEMSTLSNNLSKPPSKSHPLVQWKIQEGKDSYILQWLLIYSFLEDKRYSFRNKQIFSNKWLYYETNVFCSVHWLPKSASLSECMCVCVFVYMQIEIENEIQTFFSEEI